MKERDVEFTAMSCRYGMDIGRKEGEIGGCQVL